ncbi:MAG: RAMP superfamily CRISPR-associated protein [Myxococcota bacterium]|nr:RAMP superfamily CRISPR-associated protein [Myxococcota bacterium]
MIDRIRAPYNFVPLSPFVVFPEWANNGDFAPHDWPFKDGISGTIDIEIEALTPIFTRGTGGNPSEFFRTPDGKYAIPGSSIRGMLRNVVEIATFSKMSRVNDHRYGVRDLQESAKPYYRDHLTGTIDGVLVPKVEAGWMRLGDDDNVPAVITPCSFAKVHYDKLAGVKGQRDFGRARHGKRRPAHEKYEQWARSPPENLDVSASVKVKVRSGTAGRIGDYGVVDRLGEGPVSGTLVFTGQPRPWNGEEGRGSPKHHDFFFYLLDRSDEPDIQVSSRVFDDFKFIHSNRGQQNRNDPGPNPD